MAKKYNRYTGEWYDIYGPDTSGTPSQVPTKSEGGADTSPSPPANKATSPDKGNAHQGSGKDTQREADEKIREIEYDLEGTAEIHPRPEFSSKITARDIVIFEGMGDNFSGRYFLATVVHTINRNGYRMSFDVLRNNFNWTSADVPPDSSTPQQDQLQPKQDPQKTTQQTYTVKKGDTLWAIAKRFYGNGADFMKIVEANQGKIKDPDLIYPNQVFVIPE